MNKKQKCKLDRSRLCDKLSTFFGGWNIRATITPKGGMYKSDIEFKCDNGFSGFVKWKSDVQIEFYNVTVPKLTTRGATSLFQYCMGIVQTNEPPPNTFTPPEEPLTDDELIEMAEINMINAVKAHRAHNPQLLLKDSLSYIRGLRDGARDKKG